MFRRHTWLALCVLAVSGIAFARNPDREPRIDALASAPAQAPRELSAAERSLVQAGKDIQYEERLAVPTFIWAAPSSEREKRARLALKAEPADEARRHLATYASLYGLDKADVSLAKVVSVHDIGTGPIIVKFQQEIGGIEVFREELSVMMDRNLERIALSGYLSHAGKQAGEAGEAFRLSERAAVALALADRTGTEVSAEDLRTAGEKQGPYGYVDQGPRMRALARRAGAPDSPESIVLNEPARYKQVYFHTADGLEPGWYVEIAAELRGDEGDIDNDMYAYVISARDGRILFKHNLTVSDSFTYRLWADTSGGSMDFPSDSPHGDVTTPHPTGISDGSVPPYISSSLHTLQAYPFSHSATDPWLPAAATETVGNNVDAYIDRFGANGYTPAAGDFRAPLSSPGHFDYTYDPNLDPLANLTQQRAAITSLFYIDNFLHDFFYDAGFDEAARNGQVNNYGRGGLGGDDIRAEAQDGSGTNNANMSTPADGGRPRQQMFLWSGEQTETITVNSQPVGGTLPASYNPFFIGTAAFGPQSFDVTADVVRAIPNDACSAITNPVAGKIVFIDRGGATCPAGFAGKAANAATAGAVGVIIANVFNSTNPTVAPNMGTTNPPCPAQPGNPLGGCTIGVLSLNFADGEAWRNTLALGTVNARLKRDVVVMRDGSLDAHVVSHEWAHYLSNRLVGNAAGLSTNQSQGMGEGWSDFNSLLTTVREGDTAVPSNATWNGVFPLVSYAAVAFSADPYYFGIRRVPYSTDMTKDPLTFRHISNGQFISPPFAGPCNGCTDASQMAEVHNTGEVWSTMLWECFASLLNHHPFADARIRMRNYLVASLKMTPNAPTFIEARDAMQAAAFATDPGDYALFCAAFAKRGAGQRAVAPDRFSTTNAGVVESFICGNDLAFVSASLTPTVSCDGDAYLDNFEKASLSVTLKNVGVSTLTATTANVTSSNPSIHIANGGVINFPSSTPFTTTTGSVDVSMSGATGIQDFSLDISYNDPSLAFPPGTASLQARGNANDVLNASASDDVEASQTAWTVTGSPAGGWQRVRTSATNFVWNGADEPVTGDVQLVSPTLNVAPSGDFTFTFKHRFSYEFSGTSFYDGGVIEISTNGGASWADVGAANLSPSYNHTLVSGGTNPINGRPAYSGTSAGYPATFTTVTANLHAAFAGMAVKIRFRSGADLDTGFQGWDIDDIAFGNITNTPFSKVVAQPPAPTITTLGPATGLFGNITTLHATVAPTCGSGLPTGSVQFQINKGSGFVNIGGPVTLVGGQASTNYVVDVGAGSYPIKAIYTPDTTESAGSTGTNTLVVTRAITALSPANLWVGLANSDDVGLRFDLLAQVFVTVGPTTTQIAQSEVDNISGGSSGFNNALLSSLGLSLPASVAFPPGATLSINASARRTCTGPGHASGTARLWYNGKLIDTGATRAAGTRFDASIDGLSSNNYFLRTGLALNTTAGTSNASIDKGVNSSIACPARPFTSFGTWSITVP